MFALRKRASPRTQTLKSFSQIFKSIVPGLPGGAHFPQTEGKIEDVHERQRRAAFKAWETRRRAAKDKGKDKDKEEAFGLKPKALRLDREVEHIAKTVIPNMTYSRFQGIGRDKGINNSGIITTPDGRKMFLKMAGESGGREVGAWKVAKAIGWNDVVTPMHHTKFNGEEAIVRDLLPEGKVWHRVPKNERQQALDDKDRLNKVALYEYLINARDRHSGNYWMDKSGKLWPIDLGFSFGQTTKFGASDAYNPRDVLGRVPKALVSQILKVKDEILEAVKDVPRYEGDVSIGVRDRLAILEKAVSSARGPYANITQAVEGR